MGPRLQIPCVVFHRLVGGQFHVHTATHGQQLTVTAPVHDGRDGAVGIPGHRHRTVGHGVVGGGDRVVTVQFHQWRHRTAGHRHHHGAAIEVNDLGAGVGGGVGHVQAVGQIQSGQCVGDELFNTAGHVGEGGLGVVVHPGDGRARQDVVELLDQHLLPQVVECIGHRSRHRSASGPPQLGFAQQPFAPAVAQLGVDLTGERAAVHLEVQLATPLRHRCPGGGLGLNSSEEVVGGANGQGGHTVEVGHATGPLQHLAGGAAATVAVAKRHEGVTAPVVVREVAFAEHHLGAGHLGVVGVHRGEVREHARAVEAFPPKRAVGETVLLVPAQLLGHEPVTATGGKDLRQRGGIAKHVGDPHLGASHAEPALEVPLAVHHLAHQALATGQVHVGFNPHAAHRHELPRRHPFGDACKQCRVVAFHPVVLHGLRTGEVVLGVVVHQPGGRGKRAGALALRFAQRPQPGGVDVGVTHPHHRQRTGPSRGGQCRSQKLSGGGGGAGHVTHVHGIEGMFQGAQQLHPTRVIGVQAPHEPVEHLNIE